MKNGNTKKVRIISEKGYSLHMAIPFDGKFKINGNKGYTIKDGVIEMDTNTGDIIEFIKL